VISPEYPFYKEVKLGPDIARAKALLAEAGHANGLKVTLFAAANPPQRTDLAVAVKEMSRPAGFDIDVQTIPMDTFIATVRGKGNFYVANWQGQPTPDMQFTKLLTSKASLIDSFWNNAEFDKLVKEGEAVSDPAKRAEIYGKAQDLLAAEAPYIVPFFKDALSAHRSYVHGYFVHPLVQPNFLERVWLDADAPKRT
jgi:peptide/nickel transport system substrate-binding protein